MSNEVDPLDLDAQDAAHGEAAEEASRAKHIQEDDIRWLMSTKRGRRIIWRLLDRAGVFRLSFDQNAMAMAFNEGNRNYGNQLLSEITHLCPERYLEMLKEQKNHVRTRNRNDAD